MYPLDIQRNVSAWQLALDSAVARNKDGSMNHAMI